jgi:uncharacterized repeat protein (TIGR01451 family)
MEGNIRVTPGDWISVGYDFTMPGAHQAASVSFIGAQIGLPVRCTDAGSVVGTITVPLPTATYSIPAGSSAWYPTGAQADPSAYQAAVLAPDLCSGQRMHLNYGGSFGATFSADVRSTDTQDKVNLRFHYRDPMAKGKGNVDCADPAQNPTPGNAAACGSSWSSTASVVPSGSLPGIDLSASASANPDPAGFLQPLTYTFTVANGGSDTATGVTLTVSLPPGLSDVSSGSCAYDQQANLVTCSLGSLGAGASSSVTITGTPSDSTTLVTTATASSDQVDQVPANDSTTLSTDVTFPG